MAFLSEIVPEVLVCINYDLINQLSKGAITATDHELFPNLLLHSMTINTDFTLQNRQGRHVDATLLKRYINQDALQH